MRVNPNEIKFCEKHNIAYTNYNNSNRRRCVECVILLREIMKSILNTNKERSKWNYSLI